MIDRQDLLPLALKDSVVLREVECGDVERMVEFFDSLGERSRGFFHPHPFDRERAQEICGAKTPGAYRIVAQCEGRIVGYAWFTPWKQSPFCTVGIAVSDDFQGRGLGGALMGTLEVEARARKLPGLRLTVYKNNERGVRLYVSRGYRIVGEEGPQHVMEFALAGPP